MIRHLGRASAAQLALATLLSLVAACGAASDDTSGSGSDIHISPTGTDHLSKLTLQLPTDSCLPGGGCARPLGAAPVITIDNASATLGTAATLQPGDHLVRVNGLGWKVTLAAAQQRTVVLPIAHANCVKAALPNVPSTDFGAVLVLQNAACPTTIQATDATANPGNVMQMFTTTGCNASYAAGSLSGSTVCSSLSTSASIASVSENGTCSAWGGSYSPQQMCTWFQTGALGSQFPAPTNTPASLVATDNVYVPGPMAVQVNGAAQNYTFAEGDEQALTINLPVVGSVPATFTTSIAFLDPRSNPDAAAGTITSSCGERSYTIPATTTTTLNLAAFVNSACTYTLNVGGRTLALSQSSANSVQLHRVDVDDVTITRDIDNTTYTVRGTYQLNFGGTTVAGPYQTATGIDVLSGTYDLILKYTDANGAQTQDQTFTL